MAVVDPSTVASIDRKEIADWILGAGRQAPSGREFLRRLAERLVEAGMPLWRASAHITTLHPELRAINYFWYRGEEAVAELGVAVGVERTEMFLVSPLRTIMEERREVRGRLEEPGGRDAFPILYGELAEGGATDYVAMPMAYSDGHAQALTWATDRPGGFTEEELEGLRALMPLFGLVFELFTTRRLAITVLETYLGPRTGRQVLEGRIHRGDGEAVRAVIWFCDLRNFTRLSAELAPADLIDLLNDFFGLIADALESHGGEILKFIGDAMLAIFPLDGSSGARQAEEAVDAAARSVEAFHARMAERGASGLPTATGMGIALHVGDVVYGNIGAPGRLDFTVVGPAVNVAARMQELARELDVPIVVSRDFRALCPRPLASLGGHGLRGIPGEAEIFTLAGSDAP